jgi:hypothetical protein
MNSCTELCTKALKDAYKCKDHKWKPVLWQCDCGKLSLFPTLDPATLEAVREWLFRLWQDGEISHDVSKYAKSTETLRAAVEKQKGK